MLPLSWPSIALVAVVAYGVAELRDHVKGGGVAGVKIERVR